MKNQYIQLVPAASSLAEQVVDYYKRNRTFLQAFEPVRSEEFFSPEYQRTVLKKEGLHGNLWVNQREIHQNPSSVKRQSGITAPVGRFYSVCRLTAART